MIDYTEVRRKIETLLDSSPEIVFPIRFENTPMIEGRHIAVYTQDLDSFQTEMGSFASTVQAVLIIQIFIEIGGGTEEARKEASSIVDVVSGHNDPKLTFCNPEFNSIGEIENFGIYQHNLSIQYTYQFG